MKTVILFQPYWNYENLDLMHDHVNCNWLQNKLLTLLLGMRDSTCSHTYIIMYVYKAAHYIIIIKHRDDIVGPKSTQTRLVQ